MDFGLIFFVKVVCDTEYFYNFVCCNHRGLYLLFDCQSQIYKISFYDTALLTYFLSRTQVKRI